VLIPLPWLSRSIPADLRADGRAAEAAGGVSLYEDKPTNFVAKLTLKLEAAPHRVGQIPVTGFGAAIAVRGRSEIAMIVDEWPEGARQWLTSTCVRNPVTREFRRRQSDSRGV